MSNDTLTITDNRTGKSYDVPVDYSTIKALDLRQIKVDPDEFGMMTYDPGYGNTAACKSAITYIDGDKGILRYRGYPIEQLAEQSTFLEVAYLLIYGELPDKQAYTDWEHQVLHHTYAHENLVRLMGAFRYDAHPMGMLISALAFMSTMHPDATNVDSEAVRNKQILRILGKLPTIAAIGYYYLTNRYTGAIVYERDLMAKEALDERVKFNIDTIMRLVCTNP